MEAFYLLEVSSATLNAQSFQSRVDSEGLWMFYCSSESDSNEIVAMLHYCQSCGEQIFQNFINCC